MLKERKVKTVVLWSALKFNCDCYLNVVCYFIFLVIISIIVKFHFILTPTKCWYMFYLSSRSIFFVFKVAIEAWRWWIEYSQFILQEYLLIHQRRHWQGVNLWYILYLKAFETKLKLNRFLKMLYTDINHREKMFFQKLSVIVELCICLPTATL